MTHTSQTKIVSTHPFKRTARKRERLLQRMLAKHAEFEHLKETAGLDDDETYRAMNNALRLTHFGVPDWAKGVRLRKAGAFNWAVEATAWKGR